MVRASGSPHANRRSSRRARASSPSIAERVTTLAAELYPGRVELSLPSAMLPVVRPFRRRRRGARRGLRRGRQRSVVRRRLVRARRLRRLPHRRSGAAAADRRGARRRPISATATPASLLAGLYTQRLPRRRARPDAGRHHARRRRGGGHARARLSGRPRARRRWNRPSRRPRQAAAFNITILQPPDRHAAPARSHRPRADARGSRRSTCTASTARSFTSRSNPAIRRVAGIRLGRCSAIPPNDPDFGQTRRRDRPALVRACPAFPISAAPTSATTSTTRSCRSARRRPLEARRSVRRHPPISSAS